MEQHKRKSRSHRKRDDIRSFAGLKSLFGFRQEDRVDLPTTNKTMVGRIKSTAHANGKHVGVTPLDRFLCGSMMCEGSDIEVLAFADTMDDIIPKNKMSRYIKSRYETQSLLEGGDNASLSSEETDDGEHTLDTYGNTVDETVDSAVVVPKKMATKTFVLEKNSAINDNLQKPSIRPEKSARSPKLLESKKNSGLSTSAPWDEHESDHVQTFNSKNDIFINHRIRSVKQTPMEESPSYDKDDQSQLTRNTISTDGSGAKDTEVEVIGEMLSEGKEVNRSRLRGPKQRPTQTTSKEKKLVGALSSNFATKLKKNCNTKLRTPTRNLMKSVKESVTSFRAKKSRED